MTIPKESNPISPASPQKSPWTFLRRLTTARTLLHCHASPVRNGWLPSDSGQAWRAAPALCLSLTSVHPACSQRLGRFFIVTPRLLTTPGFPPTRDNHGRLRLPYMVIPRSGPSGLFATARRFFIVTPRLFATAGFPPIRDRHGGLRPPYAYPSLRSIQPAHDGSALRFFTLNLQTGLLTREGRGGTVCLALEENEC